MPIGEFCNREVVVAEPETTVLEAAQLMRQYHVGSIVVVDSSSGIRKPVGLITDRDLVVEVLAAQANPDTLTIGDLLIGDIATVSADAGVFDTLQYMRELGCRRMPVVDEAGRIVGIVTLDDFLGLMAEELTELARLIPTEIRHEEKERP
ncbi:MAG TPA: CBS domain-containing protein [Rhodocyclaceae bacterium]|nr:CBS domain-containing protein [Rhodocyclaceae bacterium]